MTPEMSRLRLLIVGKGRLSKTFAVEDWICCYALVLHCIGRWGGWYGMGDIRWTEL